MCRLRLERGQTTAEYVGVLVVVVAVIAAISAADIGAQVTRKIDEAIAAIATDGGLDDSRGGDPETNSQPSASSSRAAQGADYRPHLSEARLAAGPSSAALTIAPAVARSPRRGESTVGNPPVARLGSIFRGLRAVYRWVVGPGGPKPPPRPPAKPSSPKPPAPKRGLTVGERIGMLREASRRTGNYGLGSASRREADTLGQDFVGPGFTRSKRDPRILISRDGLRQYRAPSFKPKLGRYQANFERRLKPGGGFGANGHLDILP